MEIKIWNNLSENEQQEILTRPAQSTSGKVEEIVSNIIMRIQKEGDNALFEFSRTLDKYEGKDLEISAPLTSK